MQRCERPTLKSSLKRGALLTAANWPVVVVQFVAESLFKVLLAVPLVGGAVLVAVLLGGDLADLLDGDMRTNLSAVADALAAEPTALACFLLSLIAAVLGGSALVFLIKGGTVSVLMAADCTVGAIEEGGLDTDALRRASMFSVERFTEGSARLFGRYLALGVALVLLYGLSGAAYLSAVLALYRRGSEGPALVPWALVAGGLSIGLAAWISFINLIYLLVQVAIATEDRDVRSALMAVARFLRARGWDVAAVFGVVFALVVLATGVSIVATAGLGLIAFVPFVGIAVLPIQAAAWLLRGLVFQYLGLTALVAYLAQYRAFLAASRVREGPVTETADLI